MAAPDGTFLSHWLPIVGRTVPRLARGGGIPRPLVLLFGVASLVGVSNLYISQPLLNDYVEQFGATKTAASSLVALAQAGYCLGLLLITPLGDVIPRRPLVLILTSLCSVLTALCALAQGMAALQAFHFLLGLFTVLPQIVVPTVADLSNRMSVDVGLTVGCTQVGVLYGRVVSGLVADALGWRTSFGVAVATQVAVLALLILFFPEIPPAEEGSVVRYPRLILSSLKLAGTRAVLQQSAAIAFFCFLSMASYWTTSVYLMGSPAYGLPVSTIGLLGLAGMGGILAAPLAGILPFPPHKLVALGITAQFLAWTVALASGTRHLAALFACAFLTDLGRQLQQVGNQLRVFSALPGHKSRANAVYMVLAYLGTFAGTALGTLAYERAAWLGAGAVGMAALACAALAWAWVSPDGRFLWDRFRGEKRGGASEEEAVALMSDVGDGERAGLFAVGLLEELDQFGDFEGAGSLAVGVAGRMEDIEGTV